MDVTRIRHPSYLHPLFVCYFASGSGVNWSIVCLSAYVCVRPLARLRLQCLLPVPRARSSSGDTAIRHVLPVLSMPSNFLWRVMCTVFRNRQIYRIKSNQILLNYGQANRPTHRGLCVQQDQSLLSTIALSSVWLKRLSSAAAGLMMMSIVLTTPKPHKSLAWLACLISLAACVSVCQ